MTDTQISYHIKYVRLSSSTYSVAIILPDRTVYTVEITTDNTLTPRGYLCDSPLGVFYVDSPADVPYDFLRILRTEKNLPPLPIYVHAEENLKHVGCE